MTSFAKILIIDPLNDFTHVQGFYGQRHGINQITDAKNKINQMLTSINHEDIIVIRSDYRPHQFGDDLHMSLPGTFGHQVDSDLMLSDRMVFITKTDHSSFSSDTLKDYLKTSKTDTLFICGFLAEYCVKHSAHDALDAGFKVFLVEDAIATGDDVQDRKDKTLQELAMRGAKIINSKSFSGGLRTTLN
jgi:nicotinamidase/pyrazinamidase